MVQAIFFDIDGTLLSFNTHKMSEAVRDALARCKKKGIKLFISTGRHLSELSALDPQSFFDGFITLNGSYCYNESGVLYKLPLAKEDVRMAVELVKSGQIHCIFTNEYTMTTNEITEDIRRGCALADVPLPQIEDPDAALEKDIYQLCVYLRKEEEHILLDKIKNAAVMRWHESFIDVVAASSSKKEGVLKMCEAYGIDPDRCMAFGDGENDIPMLECVKYGIAMGDANEHVKKAAYDHTASVDEDGIVLALKKYGLL